MGQGEKNEEKGGKGKIRQKGEETTPKISLLVGVKLIFLREGGGNNMIHLQNIYA